MVSFLLLPALLLANCLTRKLRLRNLGHGHRYFDEAIQVRGNGGFAHEFALEYFEGVHSYSGIISSSILSVPSPLMGSGLDAARVWGQAFAYFTGRSYLERFH